MSDLPGLERREVKRRYGVGSPGEVTFFAGTDVEWGELIYHLEDDPPSCPAAFLAEYPEVTHEHLLGVLRGMAAAMGKAVAWDALCLALDGPDRSDRVGELAHQYVEGCLARRVVVVARRDEMIAAEATSEAER